MPDLCITWPENDGWKAEHDFWSTHIGHIVEITDIDGDTATFALTDLSRADDGFLELNGNPWIEAVGLADVTKDYWIRAADVTHVQLY